MKFSSTIPSLVMILRLVPSILDATLLDYCLYPFLWCKAIIRFNILNFGEVAPERWCWTTNSRTTWQAFSVIGHPIRVSGIRGLTWPLLWLLFWLLLWPTYLALLWPLIWSLFWPLLLPLPRIVILILISTFHPLRPLFVWIEIILCYSKTSSSWLLLHPTGYFQREARRAIGVTKTRKRCKERYLSWMLTMKSSNDRKLYGF